MQKGPNLKLCVQHVGPRKYKLVTTSQFKKKNDLQKLNEISKEGLSHIITHI